MSKTSDVLKMFSDALMNSINKSLNECQCEGISKQQFDVIVEFFINEFKIGSARTHRMIKVNPEKEIKKTQLKAAHIALMDKFRELYELKCGFPYRADVKDYKILYTLIQSFGLEAVIRKCRILADACDKESLWFTKHSWADFTIGKLSSRWNELLPLKTSSRWDDLFEEERRSREGISKAMD